MDAQQISAATYMGHNHGLLLNPITRCQRMAINYSTLYGSLRHSLGGSICAWHPAGKDFWEEHWEQLPVSSS